MSVSPEEKKIATNSVKEEADATTDRKVTTIGLNSTSKESKEDAENYDPSKDSYHPLKNAYWQDKKV